MTKTEEDRHFSGNTNKEGIYPLLRENPTLQSHQLAELSGINLSSCTKHRRYYFEDLDFFSKTDISWIFQFKEMCQMVMEDKMDKIDQGKKEIEKKQKRLEEKLKKFEILKTETLKTESPIEKMLYLASIDFEKLEASLIPQFKVPNTNYRVDFQHRHIHKLLIECDGKNYHDNFDKTRNTPKQNADYQRRREIEEQGYIIVNYTGSHIYNNAAEVLKLIEEKADKIYDPAYKRKHLGVSRFPQGEMVDD